MIFPLQQNVTSSAPLLRSSLPEGQANRHQQELQTEVEVLRQQLLVFQEDFDRERQDRATAQSIKDDLKKKCDQLKRQLRNNEVKLAGAETQVPFLLHGSNGTRHDKNRPEVINLFSCSTQLSTKFILLINVKMSTFVDILTFIA